MALSFQPLADVQFGEIKATPKLTTELKLRIARLGDYSKTVEDFESACKTLAKAFPEDKEEVEKFMLESMSIMDLQELQAYLVGGDKLVARTQEIMKAETEKGLK